MKDFQQVVLIAVPLKDHIVDPGANQPEKHAIDGEIPVILRILPGLFRYVGHYGDTGDHADGDNYPIQGNIKTKYREALRNIFEIQSQVGEGYIINSHYILHVLIPFLDRQSDMLQTGNCSYTPMYPEPCSWPPGNDYPSVVVFSQNIIHSSNVKPKENYVTVLYYIVFAFHAHQALFPGSGQGTLL